jgi:hypothetical protein
MVHFGLHEPPASDTAVGNLPFAAGSMLEGFLQYLGQELVSNVVLLLLALRAVLEVLFQFLDFPTSPGLLHPECSWISSTTKPEGHGSTWLAKQPVL